MTTSTTPRRTNGRGNFSTGAAKHNRNGGDLKRQRQALARVLNIVSELRGTPIKAILGLTKTKELSRTRIFAMAIGHELSGASEPETASAFNREDHNSVRHARKVWKRLMDDPATKAECLALRAAVARGLKNGKEGG